MRGSLVVLAALAAAAASNEHQNSVWKFAEQGYGAPRSSGPKSGKTARRAKQKLAKKAKQKARR